MKHNTLQEPKFLHVALNKKKVWFELTCAAAMHVSIIFVAWTYMFHAF